MGSKGMLLCTLLGSSKRVLHGSCEDWRLEGVRLWNFGASSPLNPKAPRSDRAFEGNYRWGV